MKKKLVSLLMAVTMVVSSIPAGSLQAFAEETDAAVAASAAVEEDTADMAEEAAEEEVIADPSDVEAISSDLPEETDEDLFIEDEDLIPDAGSFDDFWLDEAEEWEESADEVMEEFDFEDPEDDEEEEEEEETEAPRERVISIFLELNGSHVYDPSDETFLGNGCENFLTAYVTTERGTYTVGEWDNMQSSYSMAAHGLAYSGGPFEPIGVLFGEDDAFSYTAKRVFPYREGMKAWAYVCDRPETLGEEGFASIPLQFPEEPEGAAKISLDESVSVSGEGDVWLELDNPFPAEERPAEQQYVLTIRADDGVMDGSVDILEKDEVFGECRLCNQEKLADTTQIEIPVWFYNYGSSGYNTEKIFIHLNREEGFAEGTTLRVGTPSALQTIELDDVDITLTEHLLELNAPWGIRDFYKSIWASYTYVDDVTTRGSFSFSSYSYEVDGEEQTRFGGEDRYNHRIYLSVRNQTDGSEIDYDEAIDNGLAPGRYTMQAFSADGSIVSNEAVLTIRDEEPDVEELWFNESTMDAGGSIELAKGQVLVKKFITSTEAFGSSYKLELSDWNEEAAGNVTMAFFAWETEDEDEEEEGEATLRCIDDTSFSLADANPWSVDLPSESYLLLSYTPAGSEDFSGYLSLTRGSSSGSDDDDDTDFAAMEREAVELTVGGSYTANWKADEKTHHYYKFTPDKDGSYILYSEGERDTIAYAYSFSDGFKYAGDDDDGGDDSNFRLFLNMKAGVTYYYDTHPYYSKDYDDSSTIRIEQGHPLVAASLTFDGDNPVFVEGLSAEYYDDVYAPFGMFGSVSADLYLEGIEEPDNQVLWDCSPGTEVTTSDGEQARFLALKKNPDGSVETAFDEDDELSAGSWQLALSLNGRLVPARGETMESAMDVDHASAVPFTVITMEEAVRGRSLNDGEVSFNPSNTYCTGASYVPDTTGRIKFTSDTSLDGYFYVYTYDSAGERYERTDRGYLEDTKSFTAEFEKDKTYYVFVRLKRPSAFKLSAAPARTVESAEFSFTGQDPVFVEGLSFDDQYAPLSALGSVSVDFYYEGSSEPEHKDIAYCYPGVDVDTEEEEGFNLYAYQKQPDGSLREEGDGDRLSAGTWKLALSDYDSRLVAARGKTMTGDSDLDNAAVLPFTVITMEEAVSGRSLNDGDAAFEPVNNYFLGASYISDQSGPVTFVTDAGLYYLLVYKYESDGEDTSITSIYDNKVDDFTFRPTLEEGKTYFLFARPKTLKPFTLSIDRSPGVKDVQVTTRLPETLDSGCRFMYGDDFGVDITYEDDTTAHLDGDSADLYGNSFRYTVKKNGTVLGPISYSFALYPGEYEISAICAAGNAPASVNSVSFTVPSFNEIEEIGLNEMKEVQAGQEPVFRFTPKEDGWYSILSNGDTYSRNPHVYNGEEPASYWNQVSPNLNQRVYYMRSENLYFIEPISGGKQYVSVTRRFPETVGDEGITKVVDVTPYRSEDLLFTVEEDGFYDVSALYSEGDKTSFSYSLYAAGADGAELDYSQSSLENGGAEDLSKTLKLYSNRVYLLSARLWRIPDQKETITFSVRKHEGGQNQEELQVTLNAPETVNCPPEFAEYYLREKMTVTETVGNESVTVNLNHSNTLSGMYYYLDELDTIGGSVSRMNVKVCSVGNRSITLSTQVIFTGSLTGLPELTEGPASTGAELEDGWWFFAFSPDETGEYYFSDTDIKNYYCYIKGNGSVQQFYNGKPDRLYAGTRYVIAIVPDGNDKGKTPKLAVQKIPYVINMEITKVPEVLLPQLRVSGAPGFGIQVTYSDGSVEDYTLGVTSSDKFGNSIGVKKSIASTAVGNGRKEQLTLTLDNARVKGIFDLTPITSNKISDICQSEAAALGEAFDTADPMTYKCYRFTPAQTGAYQLKTDGSNKRGDIWNYASLYKEDELSYFATDTAPTWLEAGKTYLILYWVRGVSENNHCWIEKVNEDDTEPLTATLTYVYEDEDGHAVPAAVNDSALPGVNGQETYPLRTEIVPAAPKQEEVAADDGIWAFVGYEVPVVRLGADTTVKGIWRFEEGDTYPLTYSFVAAAGSPELTDDVLALLSADGNLPTEERYVEGRVVTPTRPVREVVETDEGYWTFAGYTPETVAMTEGGAEVIGTWRYTQETADVTYEFVSGSEDEEGNLIALPEEITELKPDDEAGVVKNSRVSVPQPEPDVWPTDHGNWTFTGYTVTGAAEYDEEDGTILIGKENVTIIGTWTYADEYHNVTFEYVSDSTDDEGNVIPLPSSIASKVPAPADVLKGELIDFPEVETPVETENGHWEFVEFDREEDEAVSADDPEDIVITGSWIYENEFYPVTYKFTDEDGNEESLPEGVKELVQELVQTGTEALKGTVVTAVRPGTEQVTDGADKWNFIGYFIGTKPADSAKMTKDGIEFIGKWSKKTLFYITYVFVSGTDGKELPADFVTEPSKTAVFEGTVPTEADLAQPSQTVFKTEEGTWTFDGYDTSALPSEMTEDIPVYGIWSFTSAEAAAEEAVNTISDETSTPADVLDALDKTDSDAILAQYQDDEGQISEENLAQVETLTQGLDDKLTDTSGEGQDPDPEKKVTNQSELEEGETYGIYVGPTKNGEDSEGGLKADVSGAAATVAGLIRTADHAELEANNDKHYQAVVDVKVTEQVPGELLKFELELNVVVQETGQSVEKDVALAAPVTVTLTIPEAFVGYDFDLIHVVEGAEQNVNYTVSDDGKTVTFAVSHFSEFRLENLSCRHKAKHVEAKDPTCTEPGNIEYWVCEGPCGKYFKTEAMKPEDEITEAATVKPAAGHNMKKVEAVAATCSAEGNIEYYKCDNGCGFISSDAAGEHEITDPSSVVIAKKAHDWGNWTVSKKATVLAAGEEKRVCKNNSAHVETRPIQKLTATLSLKVGDFKVDGATLPMKTKQKFAKITAEMVESDGIKSVTSNNKLVTVSFSGNTITVKAGKKAVKKAVITVLTKGGAQKTFNVKVTKKKVTAKKAVNFPKKLTMKVGETKDLKVYITPVTTPDKLKFSSDKKKIVAVNKKTGVLTAKKKGKAVITLKAGKKIFKCKVTVK